MLRKIFIVLLFILATLALHAQPLVIDWQHCYGGSGVDIARALVPTTNGFFVIGGTDSHDGDISYNHGEDDIWLLSVDTTGNLLWEKSFGGSNSEIATRIFSYDNDYLIAGGSNSSDGDISNNPYEVSSYWITKIDSTGAIIWDRIVGGNGRDELWNATLANDGSVVAVGYTSSSDGDITTYYGLYDMWVIKINNDGSTDWDFTIGTSSHDYAQAVIQTSDGGFLIGGSSMVEGTGNITCVPHSTKGEAVLFKLDSNGVEEWHQCYGGSDDDGVSRLIEIADGYVFTAFGRSDDGDLEGSGWHGESDIWVVKTDFSGNILWQKCFGGSDYESGTNIFELSDGSLMIFGRTKSFDGDISFNPSLSSDRYSIWVLKISSEGELIWEQCIGGIGKEFVLYGVHQKSDHEYVVAGEMTYSPSYDVDCSNHINNGLKDYWIFHLTDITISVEEKQPIPQFSIYPNPAQTILNCQLSGLTDRCCIKVVDLHGRALLLKNIPKDHTNIQVDVSEIPSGIYFVRLFTETGVGSSKKVVIMK
jgi:hypothetical protein